VLARWINAVCQGFAVQARSGATREELHRVADQALTGWPKYAFDTEPPCSRISVTD